MMSRRFFLIPLTTLALIVVTSTVSAQDLWVDFNSTTQDDGPHNQEGYQPYNAGHEAAEDFVTKSFSAFGGTVDFTPAWPDTTDSRVQQMIDRSDNFDANWLGDKLDLVTDFIGIDTRTGNGGNGDNPDGTGTPTRMTFTLSGVPEGLYNWRSYHHDTEQTHAAFLADISVDGGSTFTNIGQFQGTNSSPGANPPPEMEYPGEPGMDPALLPSTINHEFTATGDDVVVQFTPLSTTAVHAQILAVNGFELSVVPEPTSVGLLLIGMLGLLRVARHR